MLIENGYRNDPMMSDCKGFFNVLIRFIISKTDFVEPEILPYLIHFSVPSNLSGTGRGTGQVRGHLLRRSGPGSPTPSARWPPLSPRLLIISIFLVFQTNKCHYQAVGSSLRLQTLPLGLN